MQARRRAQAPGSRVGVVIPWLILALVAVPLVVVAFLSLRGRTVAGEHPASEDAAARARTELAGGPVEL